MPSIVGTPDRVHHPSRDAAGPRAGVAFLHSFAEYTVPDDRYTAGRRLR